MAATPHRPNFFILGAAKSGTTSLYDYLGQHPDVFFSTPKEPIFFEAEFEKGLAYYWEHYFGGWNGEAAVGEARHRNLYLPYIAPRIHECCPDARLIVILRNPVDRAFSDWMMRRASGADPLSFEDAVDEDMARIEAGVLFEGDEGERLWKQHILPIRAGKNEALTRLGAKMPELRHRTYVDTGYYEQQIERYLLLFSRDRLEVVLLEDLSRDPQAVCAQLWRLLGVDPDYNLARVAPSNVRGKLLTTRARRAARKLLGEGLLAKLPSGLRAAVSGTLDRSAPANPVMDPGMRRRLIDHYAPHNDRLARLIDCDLSSWQR